MSTTNTKFSGFPVEILATAKSARTLRLDIPSIRQGPRAGRKRRSFRICFQNGLVDVFISVIRLFEGVFVPS